MNNNTKLIWAVIGAAALVGIFLYLRKQQNGGPLFSLAGPQSSAAITGDPQYWTKPQLILKIQEAFVLLGDTGMTQSQLEALSREQLLVMYNAALVDFQEAGITPP